MKTNHSSYALIYYILQQIKGIVYSTHKLIRKKSYTSGQTQQLSAPASTTSQQRGTSIIHKVHNKTGEYQKSSAELRSSREMFTYIFLYRSRVVSWCYISGSEIGPMEELLPINIVFLLRTDTKFQRICVFV